MAKTTSVGTLPRVGDLVYLCPDVGAYGQPPAWVRVLGVRHAILGSHAYLRGYLEEAPDTPRVWYVRLDGLRVRPDHHTRECNG